jgi:hypothetical protein
MKRQSEAEGSPDAARVGLCADCEFVRRIVSAKGSEFIQCGRAKHDPTYLQYPPVPVRDCEGYRSAAKG